MEKINELEGDYKALVGQLSIGYEKFKERYSLAKAISSVSFSKEITSNIKKQCYSRLIKLCELWFAFEKFLNLLEELGFILDNTLSKPSLISEETINSFDLHTVVKETSDEINVVFDTEQKKKKLKDFINHLHSKGDDRQKKLLNASVGKIDNIEHNNLKLQEVLSMIYAIRNLHVHDGDTFIDAMKSFELMKDLLDILVSFIEKTVEKSWKKAIELNIEKIEKE